MTDNGRKHGVHGKNHRKNAGGGATAPAESVEQGDVKDPETRVETTSESKNDEGKGCDEPGCRRKTHDDK
jgi:hypothetical protein